MDENSGIFVVTKRKFVRELKPMDIFLEAGAPLYAFDFGHREKVFSEQKYSNDIICMNIVIKDKEIMLARLRTVNSIFISNSGIEVAVKENNEFQSFDVYESVYVLKYISFGQIEQKFGWNLLSQLVNFT